MRCRRRLPYTASGAVTIVGSPLGVGDTGAVALHLGAKVMQAIGIYSRRWPNPRRYPARQHRCRGRVAADMASAQLTLAPRIRAAWPRLASFSRPLACFAQECGSAL